MSFEGNNTASREGIYKSVPDKEIVNNEKHTHYRFTVVITAVAELSTKTITIHKHTCMTQSLLSLK